jgi:hypothetical protein
MFFFHFCGLSAKIYFPSNPDNRESTVFISVLVEMLVVRRVRFHGRQALPVLPLGKLGGRLGRKNIVGGGGGTIKLNKKGKRNSVK